MILHVDMDAYYAAVEERDHPELVGQPVIVGGAIDGRGVVAAANYEARKFGVHRAMPASTAKRLCPHAVFMPTRMKRYSAISRQIREILERFTPVIEPLALDEAFLDVSGSLALFGGARRIATNIKTAIRDELRLTASVGAAPIKFVAKIASDIDKPDGLVVVESSEIRSFLEPLPIQRMWGVGKVPAEALQRMGIRTLGHLRDASLDAIELRFGKSGGQLWRLANGIDARGVVPDHCAKSISHETTFARDIGDLQVLRSCLLELTDQVARRLRRQQLVAGLVQLKLRGGDFRTVTRSLKLPLPTAATDELWCVADDLLQTRLPADLLPLRLLGMGVSDLRQQDQVQGQLFDRQQRDQKAKADAVGDAIRDRFGADSLRRGATLNHDRRRPNEPPPPRDETDC